MSHNQMLLMLGTVQVIIGLMIVASCLHMGGVI